MTVSFVDSTGYAYVPVVVNTLTWSRNPMSVNHQVLSEPANGSTVTNLGEGARTGHFDVVAGLADDADILAESAVSGVQFNDDTHYLNGIVIKATSPISITQDANTKASFMVSFDWVELT